MKRRNPGQTLVVGKQEYKSIIESRLVSVSWLFFLYLWTNLSVLDLLQGINCLHNDVVMEVMWGMQRHMHRLVPMEKSELPKEDRVPMSQGLQMLLSVRQLICTCVWVQSLACISQPALGLVLVREIWGDLVGAVFVNPRYPHPYMYVTPGSLPIQSNLPQKHNLLHKWLVL